MIPQNLINFKNEAIKCSLAYIQVPDANESIADDACEYFKSKAWEKKVTAEIKSVSNHVSYVLINPIAKNSDKDSINYHLLRKGLARIDPNQKISDSILEYWREAEVEGEEANPDIITAYKEKEVDIN